MKRLEGKTAIVTAGGSGLGRVITETFLKEGANVVIASRNLAKLEACAEELKDLGTVFPVRADISVEEDVKNMTAAAVERFGRIDILVNNTGTPGPICDLTDMDLEAWNEALKVNVTGTMLCCREVVKQMKQQGGGSVIMISAETARIHGWGGFPTRASYMVCKTGMEAIQAAIAVEDGPYGVRCNTVSPAAIKTGRMYTILQKYADASGRTLEEQIRIENRRTTLRRLTEPADVAACCLFLASDESIAVTNQILSCSSGLALKADDVHEEIEH